MTILLTCADGSMDALSLFGLGGVFASGLSGNTIVLEASLAQGESTKALLGIFIFIGYILGAEPAHCHTLTKGLLFLGLEFENA